MHIFYKGFSGTKLPFSYFLNLSFFPFWQNITKEMMKLSGIEVYCSLGFCPDTVKEIHCKVKLTIILRLQYEQKKTKKQFTIYSILTVCASSM